MDALTASQMLEFVVELDRKGRDQPGKKGRKPAALCPPSHQLSLGQGVDLDAVSSYVRDNCRSSGC